MSKATETPEEPSQPNEDEAHVSLPYDVVWTHVISFLPKPGNLLKSCKGFYQEFKIWAKNPDVVAAYLLACGVQFSQVQRHGLFKRFKEYEESGRIIAQYARTSNDFIQATRWGVDYGVLSVLKAGLDRIVAEELNVIQVLTTPLPNSSLALIHSACRYGHYDLVCLMFEHGAKDLVNAKCAEQELPLHWACVSGNPKLVEMLLEHGADYNYCHGFGGTPLHFAATWGSMSAAQILLNAGADLSIADYAGRTPLYSALSACENEIAKLFIDKGAAINCQDREGWSPLHTAAKEGNVACVKLLLARGADPHLQDNQHLTALQSACEMGFAKVVEVLVDCYEVPDASSEEYTALHAACKGSHLQPCSQGQFPQCFVQIVETLLKKGYPVVSYHAGYCRSTPLHYAATNGCTEVVKVLLQRDPTAASAINTKGRKPLHNTCACGSLGTGVALLEHDQDVNLQDEEGKTPLHHACIRGRVEMAKVLLDAGADMNILDYKMKRPADYARVHFTGEITALLQSMCSIK